MCRFTWLAIASLLSAPLAFAQPAASDVQNFLRDFRQNPARVMNQLPPKKGAKPKANFERSQIASGEFVAIKDQLRKKLFPRATIGGRAGIESGDRPELLVDHPEQMLSNPSDMTRYRSGELEESPWSDDYWAFFTGGLGKRYNDPYFPTSWKQGYDEVTGAKTYSRLRAANPASALDIISPAEKYDLLVGNQKFEFAESHWNLGRSYYEEYGTVELWMGLCHGWAVASYMLPRPTHAVEVMAADGVTKLKFYPSDIKALATTLWANVPYQARFAGGRCNDKKPNQDENGRVLSQQCFDTNPGTFHMALVNQIGVTKRSFVMDATYDYEVWNHPIHSYSFTYFNPETGETGTLAQARIPREAFTKDKFPKYRSANAKQIVGVAMNVTYVVETYPTTSETDHPGNDGLSTVTYYYDLELDESGSIVGGEWYQNAHPDFLWTAEPEERLMTAYDTSARGNWELTRAMPASWQTAANQASMQNLPLAKIVERLIFESRLQN